MNLIQSVYEIIYDYIRKLKISRSPPVLAIMRSVRLANVPSGAAHARPRSPRPRSCATLLRKLAQTLVDAKEKVLGEIERCARKHATRHLTHDRLAKLTGLNRVTVTRTLRDLQEAGRVSLDESGRVQFR